ncbi:hypothetical protein ACIB24_19265 [Spongisporangium articulatum]|uniref:ATP-binding protein n=1 Tax=Spongisporangium articulatum TaxID=3362603 RepID=A0ABW8AS40_9ACTN
MTVDPLGPFGNPDGSRAEIDRLLGDFVDFGHDNAFGALATRAEDSTARVIAGKLGAGKTVYLRRLQDHQARQASVYADVPRQDPPSTEVIVRACQWFSGQVLVEKWMQIWSRAILRAVVSHLLLRAELRVHVPDLHLADLETGYTELLGKYRRPRSIYNQVREIINDCHTAGELTRFLDNPLWDDLEDVLGEVIAHCPPLYFYLDAVDEEFGHAPMYWLKCQEGLFYQVMRMLRDHRFGGRLHVVVSIRDIVMSSVRRSEHAPRYHDEPHLRVLTWDADALTYLLQDKVRRLPEEFVMRRTTGDATLADWLGLGSLTNEWGVRERVEEYIIRHTRMIPRDVVSVGNELAAEVLRQKRNRRAKVPEDVVRQVVVRAAKRFGDSQLAQCANQVSSDLMPHGAATHTYSELYTSTQSYIAGVQDEMRSIVRLVGAARFPRADLEGLREIADPHFESATDLGTVLWMNGLLGYLDDGGREVFYTLGDVDEFKLPADVVTYVVHPCLAASVGLGTSGAALREA